MFLKHPFTTSIHFDEKVDTSKKTETEIADEKTKKDIEDLAKKEGLEDKDDKKDDKETKKDDEELEDEEEGDLDEDEEAKAKELYKALKDPNAAPHVIRSMAAAAGIKLSDVETKQDVKVATKTIKELIKEEMGEEYKFLGDKLGTVIEKVLTTYVDTETAKVKAEVAADREEKQRDKLGEILDTVFAEYTNVDAKVQKKVYELVKDIPPKPGTDPKTYFRRMVKLAGTELNINLTASEMPDREERRERNRNDVQNRLRSKDMADEKNTEAKSKDLTIDEAVRKGIADAEASFAKK